MVNGPDYNIVQGFDKLWHEASIHDVENGQTSGINKEEFDVRVILPKYACIKQEWKDKLEYQTNFSLDYNWKSRYVGIFK